MYHLIFSHKQRGSKIIRAYTLSELGTVTPNIQLPMNAVEQRDSAHFQEISYRYHMAMTELMARKYVDIMLERGLLTQKEKLTRYAHPKYVYQQRKLA